MTQLADVFKLNPKGLNVRRGLGVLVVMGVPLIVMHVINQEVYYLSLAFGALFVGLNDPGGQYGHRLPRLALNAGAGALLTALGVSIGAGAWGVVVLVAFVVTLVAGLMVKYGLHGFSSAYVLNCWFLVAIAMPVGYHLSHGRAHRRGPARPHQPWPRGAPGAVHLRRRRDRRRRHALRASAGPALGFGHGGTAADRPARRGGHPGRLGQLTGAWSGWPGRRHRPSPIVAPGRAGWPPGTPAARCRELRGRRASGR